MRSLQLLGVTILCCFNARGDELPERAVKTLEKAVVALRAEAGRLEGLGKSHEAKIVSGAITDLEQKVLDRKDSPEAYALRQRLFARSVEGNWVRPTFKDRYSFRPDGTVVAIDPTERVTNKGRVQRFVTDSCVEYRWESGHIWKIQAAGGSMLAVVETLGADRVGDGIVLERK